MSYSFNDKKLAASTHHFIGWLPVSGVPSPTMTEERVFVVSLLPVLFGEKELLTREKGNAMEKILLYN